MNMRSFCCVPAGVSTTMLVPLFTVFVVLARSLTGVVFLSVAVTVQLGVPPEGRRARMFAAPVPELLMVVAAFGPVAPARGCTASAVSVVTKLPLPVVGPTTSASSVMSAGGLHGLHAAPSAHVATTIAFDTVVVMLGVVYGPLFVAWPDSARIGFVPSTPEYTSVTATQRRFESSARSIVDPHPVQVDFSQYHASAMLLSVRRMVVKPVGTAGVQVARLPPVVANMQMTMSLATTVDGIVQLPMVLFAMLLVTLRSCIGAGTFSM